MVLLIARTIDRIIPKWGAVLWKDSYSLKVNSLRMSKSVLCSVSLMLTVTWGTDILFDKLRPETVRGWIWKTTFSLWLFLWARISCKTYLLFLISLVVIRILMVSLFISPNYWLNSRRRYNLKGASGLER